jgi:hypothetical protein
MPEYKDIVAVLATLVAAFAGAWGAFLLESQRRQREERDRNFGAGNRAIYTIFNLWNTLEQFRKEVLEPHRGRPDAWLNMAAQPATSVGDHRFEAGDLQFLLQGKHAPVYAALFLEEQRFELAIGLIRQRNQIVLDKVFPRMAAAGFTVGRSATEQDVVRALGIDVVHQLKMITAALYKNVDEDLASLKSRYEELRSAMVQLNPSRKPLQVVFENGAA